METSLWFWIFNAAVLCVLAIDLFAFQRKAHAPSAKEAAIWIAIWVTLSLGFNALVWYWMGPAKSLDFLTGYLIEYSLSGPCGVRCDESRLSKPRAVNAHPTVCRCRQLKSSRLVRHRG